MLGLLWAMTRGYRLRPWRSPYLRWRIETYSGLCADRIGFAEFWRFAWRERRSLVRYLHWAERMKGRAESVARREPAPPNEIGGGATPRGI